MNNLPLEVQEKIFNYFLATTSCSAVDRIQLALARARQFNRHARVYLKNASRKFGTRRLEQIDTAIKQVQRMTKKTNDEQKVFGENDVMTYDTQFFFAISKDRWYSYRVIKWKDRDIEFYFYSSQLFDEIVWYKLNNNVYKRTSYKKNGKVYEEVIDKFH